MPQKCTKNLFRGSPASLLGGSGGLPGVSWAPLGHSWVLVGRSWAPLGRFLGPLGHLLAGLGRLLGTCWLSGTPRSSNLGCFGSVQGGFGTPSGQVWARLLRTVAGSTSCALFHSIQFRSVPIPSINSIPFHSIPHYSIPFHYIPFCRTIPYRSIPFHCHSLHAVLGFRASRIPESDASDMPTCRFPDLEPPISLSRMREA